VLSGSEKNAQITWFRNDLDEGAGFGTAQPVVRQLAEAK
jgi:hypothetical protein